MCGGDGSFDPAGGGFNPTTGVIDPSFSSPAMSTGGFVAPTGGMAAGGGAVAPTFGAESFGPSMPLPSGGGAPSITPAQIGSGAVDASGGQFNPITGVISAAPTASNFAAGGAAPVSSMALPPAGMDSFAASNFANEAGSGAISPSTLAAARSALGSPGAPAGAASPGLFGTGISLGDVAKLALPAGVLGFAAANRPKLPDTTATTNTLNNQATNLSAQSAQLTSPLTTGVLPAGAQASIDDAVRSAQAAIRSRFASQGLSGTPMEAEALNSAEMSGKEQGFQIAQQLAQTGLSEAQLSSSIYESILQNTLQQDQQLQNAITNFATAAAGGGQGVTLKVA